MSELQLAWAAGYLSGHGTMTITGSGVRLVLKTTKEREPLERFVDALRMGINVRPTKMDGKMGWSVTITGGKLHLVMQKLWPWLTNVKKRQYAELRRGLSLQ